MANLCYNAVFIMDATSEQIAEILEYAQDFDCEKIFPYPTPENDNRNWRINNWGSRGVAISVSRSSEGEFYFDTAWTPQLGVTKKLSERFPEVSFKHSFYEGGVGFEGYSIFKNGDVLEKEFKYISDDDDGEEEDTP